MKFLFSKGRRHRKRGHDTPVGNELNLAECREKIKYKVLKNPVKKIIEMGVYPNSIVTAVKNDKNNPNIIIGVGESRYILSKNVAQKIIVVALHD